MKIHAIWRGDGAFEVNREIEKAKIGKRLILDREYEIDIKTRRNLRKHDLYWLFLESWAHHMGGSAKTWHEHFKKLFMRKRTVTLKNGLTIELPESEAFDRCTEEEFDKYFVDVQRQIVLWGYSLEEIIQTATI